MLSENPNNKRNNSNFNGNKNNGIPRSKLYDMLGGKSKVLHNWSKVRPVFQWYKIDRSDPKGLNSFKFAFRCDKYEYGSIFALPLFDPLPKIDMNTTSTIQLDVPTGSSEFIQAIYYPLTLLDIKVKSLHKSCDKNLGLLQAMIIKNRRNSTRSWFNPTFIFLYCINMILTLSRNVLNTSMMAYIERAIAMLGFSVTGLYFAAIAVSYFILPVLKNRLNIHFDDIENTSKSGNIESAYTSLRNIGILNRALLLPRYQNNFNLIYRYNYLDAFIAEKWGDCSGAKYAYEQALKYAISENEKYVCLRGVINSNEASCKQTKNYSSYEDDIYPYVSQISTASSLHKELGTLLQTQLESCQKKLLSENYHKAIEEFNNIHYDAYSINAFPNFSVMYYQLDSILTILGKDYPGCTPGMSSCGNGINIAKNNLLHAQYYLEKFFSEKAHINQHYVNEFNEFLNKWPTTIAKNASRKMTPFADSKLSQVVDADIESNTDGLDVDGDSKLDLSDKAHSEANLKKSSPNAFT